ncbi:MAG: hypothetical protein ACXVBF_02185 [Flavisolibacter sp.]
MKRNLTLLSAATVLLGATTYFFTEGWIYMVAAFMALTIVMAIRQFPKLVTRFTRWAKEHPFEAQVLITILQVMILSIGLILGYNLKQLGYGFSQVPLFIFGILLSLGFAFVPLVQRKRIIALPVNLNRDRIAYMSIALSAFAIMVVTGNRVETTYPNSGLCRVLKSIDQSMFSEKLFADRENETTATEASFFQQTAFASIAVNGGSVIHPGKELPANNKMLKKAKRFEKRFGRHKEKMMKRIEALRKAVSGWATAGVVFLVILLIVVACAGVCLALSGGGAGAVIGGIALLALAIFAIVKLVSPKKPKEPNPPKSET